MTKLYRAPLSGNSHRVQLFLSLIGRPVELVDVNLRTGENRTPAFLKLNPLGQIPVLEDEGNVVPDSLASLVYLAERYAPESWYPRDLMKRVEIQRWLTVAACEIAQGPVLARVAAIFGANLDVERAKTIAARIFAVMEDLLAKQPFLTGEGPTIADIACYTYIAHAPEGGISLEPYPALRAWLGRIEALPGFVAMPASAPPAA